MNEKDMRYNLLGIPLFILQPFLGFILGGYKIIISKKNSIFFAAAFGMIGYRMNISESGDMGRIFESLSILAKLDFYDFISHKASEKGDFLFYILGYLILKTGMNIRVLAFLCSTLYYKAIVDLFLEGYEYYCEREDREIILGSLLLLFILNLNIFQFIGNMRFIFALSFFIRGALSEVRSEKWSSFYYILAVMVHISLAPLVISLFLKNIKIIRNNLKKINYISLLLAPFGVYFYMGLTNLILKIPLPLNILAGIQYKVNRYIYEDPDRVATHFIYVISVEVLMILIFYLLNISKILIPDKERFMVRALLVTPLINFQFKEVFFRTSIATIAIGSLVISYVFYKASDSMRKKIYIIILFLICINGLVTIDLIRNWKPILLRNFIKPLI